MVQVLVRFRRCTVLFWGLGFREEVVFVKRGIVV